VKNRIYHQMSLSLVYIEFEVIDFKYTFVCKVANLLTT